MVPRREARLADNQPLVEFLDALLEPEQRPGIGGAILVQQEAAGPPREIGGRAVYRADVVDRDGAGLAEVRHGARGFALDSPLEEGGFELSRSLATVSSGGALWRSVASREIGTPGAGGRIGFVGQNSRRERDSLIRAEISLIADLNSLQDHKKFPVPVRRELARKPLVQGTFLVRLMRRRAQNR